MQFDDANTFKLILANIAYLCILLVLQVNSHNTYSYMQYVKIHKKTHQLKQIHTNTVSMHQLYFLTNTYKYLLHIQYIPKHTITQSVSTSTHNYSQVRTNTHQYVQFVQVHPNAYQYKPLHTIHTNTYQYM